jgi:hypothetical protein
MSMSEPIVFISHFRVKEGKLDGFKQFAGEVIAAMEAGKPRTVGYLVYQNDEGHRADLPPAFADAESMDLHFQGADERTQSAYEFIEPQGFEIYGTPSDAVLQGMRQEASGE